MKILKVYTGPITDSYAGRDDGLPETKLALYNNMESLAKSYGEEKSLAGRYGIKANTKYYKLEEIDPKKIANEVAFVKKDLKEKRKQEVIAKKERLYEMLKKELGK